MEANHLWLYVLAEALILALGAAAFFYWKARRLAMRLRCPPGETGDGSPLDDYVDLLQSEILKAEARLAHLAQDKAADPDEKRLIETRLAFLRAERRAIDTSGNDEESFWTKIADGLAPLLPQSGNDADSTAEAPRSTVLESLQTQIDAYKARIANLEQFKDRFFELKAKLADSHALNEQVHTEVEKIIPAAEQPPELAGAMARLRQENSDLTAELARVEEEFAALMRNAQAAETRQNATNADLNQASGQLERSLDRVKQILVTKEEQISALQGLVNELQLELKEKERLQAAIDDLAAQNKELDNVVTILQDENNFLQQQISALLKEELEKEEKQVRRIQGLQEELDEQIRAFAELEKKYAAMEQEYLAMYEENQQLKGS